MCGYYSDTWLGMEILISTSPSFNFIFLYLCTDQELLEDIMIDSYFSLTQPMVRDFFTSSVLRSSRSWTEVVVRERCWIFVLFDSKLEQSFPVHHVVPLFTAWCCFPKLFFSWLCFTQCLLIFMSRLSYNTWSLFCSLDLRNSNTDALHWYRPFINSPSTSCLLYSLP